MVEVVTFDGATFTFNVSIRRADYWLVEDLAPLIPYFCGEKFQSAGRIIGWLKHSHCLIAPYNRKFQSAGRIIGWLKLAFYIRIILQVLFQSAGRIIGWLL